MYRRGPRRQDERLRVQLGGREDCYRNVIPGRPREPPFRVEVSRGILQQPTRVDLPQPVYVRGHRGAQQAARQKRRRLPVFFFFWKGFWSSRTGGGAASASAAPRSSRLADRTSRRRRRGPTELDAICAAWSARFTTTCVPPPSERARYGASRSVTRLRGSPRSGSSEAPPKEPPGSLVRMPIGVERLHRQITDARRAEGQRAAAFDASVAARVRRDARPPRERRRVVGRGFFFSTSPIPPNGRLVVMVVD